MSFLARLLGRSQTAASPTEIAQGDYVLVDVREASEFAAGHIPEARHVPLAKIPAELDRLRALDQPVAFVCRTGARSARATQQARGAGIDARNLRGGMLAWKRAGLPTSER